MEIDKIVASGIGLRDIYSSEKFDIPEDSEVVLFDRDVKVKSFSAYYEDPLKLLIALCYDTNFLTTEGFKIYNTGYGCLDIVFGSYQYTVQFGDGIPQVESLREDGTIIASSMLDSKLYMKDDSMIPYNIPIPDPYNHDVTRFLFILNYTEYGQIIRDSLREFIILDQYSYGKPYKIYGHTNSREVLEMVETYNTYLERAGWHRKILYDNLQDIIPGSRFGVLNTEDNRSYPRSSEGSGFRRFLCIVEAVEEAKRQDLPLIIENYGEGIDEDKCEVLFDMIKESGINIVLSS